ncbi:MAG: hypothetical protein JKY30_01740 [Flavobacteriales bacterium]|nr:hypothetical protein [Flavobacteriales bacterium]
MNSIFLDKTHLKVKFTENEKIDASTVKRFFHTGIRMSKQRKIRLLAIDLKSSVQIKHEALKLTESLLKKLCKIPVIIVSS